tara:strand:- start:21 stop:584 length:564 start_codon:yes stop_codon:yes gene_type:complete
MKKEKQYNIPVSWIQQGLLTVRADNLQEAVTSVENLDLAPMNLVGQTAPNSTRVAYSIIKSYVPDEVLTEEITLFTSSRIPDCPFCEKARAWFKANSLNFKEVDVALDESAARKVFERTNQMSMPMIEVGNEILIGFTEPELKATCQKYGFIEAEPEQPLNGPPVPPIQPTAKDPKVVKLNKETVKE